MIAAATNVNAAETNTHTAPAASGRLSSSSSLACWSLVLPNPTEMLVSTTLTSPVPRPVSMMANQSTAGCALFDVPPRRSPSFRAPASFLPLLPTTAPSSELLFNRVGLPACIGDSAACVSADDDCTARPASRSASAV